MYKIYCDDVCVYDPSGGIDRQVQNPKLILEQGKAGSLSFVMPPINIGYDSYKVFKSTIRVMSNNTVYWVGRILDDTEDINKCKSINCEGALNFLKDIIQPIRSGSMSTIVTNIFNYYNSRVSIDRQFKMGSITTVSNYDSMGTTYDQIVSANPNITVRYEEDGMYLDADVEISEDDTQTVEFGKNLLDYSATMDVTDIVTCIIPKGEKNVNIASVNNGKIYIESPELIDLYGVVEKIIEWPNITQPINLLRLAQEYLSSYQFDGLVLEVSVFDLHILDSDIPNIKIGDQIRCISNPHGMDRVFPVTKINLPLDDPSGMTITLNKDKSPSMSEQASDISDKVDQVDELVDEKLDDLDDIIDDKINNSELTMLEQAKKDAAQLILSATGGYVTLVPDETGEYVEQLIISDTADYTEANRYWVWNINGLGYFNKDDYDLSDPDSPERTRVAMTMNGEIVADFITTGTMMANRIKGGTLSIGGIDNENGEIVILNGDGEEIGRWDQNGIVVIDNEGVEIGRWNNDGIFASAGTFSGVVRSGDIDNGKPGFELSKGILKGYNENELSAYFSTWVTFTIDDEKRGYGIRMAGREGISLHTPVLGVSSEYVEAEENATISLGGSGVVKVITGISTDSDGNLAFSHKDLHFLNGILVTDPGSGGEGEDVEPEVPMIGQRALEAEYQNIFWVIEDHNNMAGIQRNKAAKYSYEFEGITDFMYDSYPLAWRYRKDSAADVPLVSGTIFYHSDEDAYYVGADRLSAYPILFSLPSPQLVHYDYTMVYLVYVGQHEGKWYISNVIQPNELTDWTWRASYGPSFSLYSNNWSMGQEMFDFHNEYDEDMCLVYSQKYGLEDGSGTIVAADSACITPSPVFQFYWSDDELYVMACIGYTTRADNTDDGLRADVTKIKTKFLYNDTYGNMHAPKTALETTELTSQCYRTCLYMFGPNSQSHAIEFRRRLLEGDSGQE